MTGPVETSKEPSEVVRAVMDCASRLAAGDTDAIERLADLYAEPTM